MTRSIAVAILVVFLSVPHLESWFDGGHMTVAYIAYRNLTPGTRRRVDALVKLNPMYDSWVKRVAKNRHGVTAFLKAATWADCIKVPACSPGYSSDGGNEPPGDATDARNIGYADKLMHKYWHFIDVPYPAGAPGVAAKTPNALTEIALLEEAIGGTESDEIKSYDVAWLEHLVGDLHQPLHCAARFTRNHPNGDAGGNFVMFCEKPCRDNLHAYWDGLLGDKPSVRDVMRTGNRLLAGDKPGSVDSPPQEWVDEGFRLAKTVVYVPPISEDNDRSTPISARPGGEYAAKAAAVAQTRVRLAGYRLAALLNRNLK